MTVAERGRDQFPIGMRVLAVDDDPICLKLLESLLLRCQYHVTTTNQAIVALKMLRENKDDFDLVISDVHMPDMDGFKLLELVGLEMDLPVIMLSANGETQAVMKGISHGAVDYLLKPVRIEELKNIWQHVLRKKKVDPRDKNNVDSGDECDKVHLASFEGEQGSMTNSDRNERVSRKRKDQNEENDDDEENEADNDDPSSSQKKPRVVWSVELHRKFVNAVSQLGIEKAVPKRILDLMNVEKLTRENVASHLQKYRLYLKRLSANANQHANMAAALRGRDPSMYMPMAPLDNYSNYNSLVTTRPSSARSFPQTMSLPRMNNLNGYGIQGQLGRTLTSSNSVTLPTQRGTLLQGMPASLEVDRGFSHTSITKTTLLHQNVGFNQVSAGIPTLTSDPFEMVVRDSSHFGNQSWQNATTSTKFPTNTLPMSVPFTQSDTIPPLVSHLGTNAHDVMSSLIDPLPSGDKLLNFGNSGDSRLKWQDAKQPHLQNSNIIYNSGSISAPFSVQDSRTGSSGIGARLNQRSEGLSEEMRSNSGFGSSGCSLDDLVNSMIKPERDDFNFADGDIGCNDIFNLSACM